MPTAFALPEPPAVCIAATHASCDIADLIWSCAGTSAYISRFERPLPGDLIYTGTPADVGAVLPGDVIDVTIACLEALRVTIRPKEAAFA